MKSASRLNSRVLPCIVGVVLAFHMHPQTPVQAQTNVRGWYAHGQVWIVWEGDPLNVPITYDIFASTQLATDTSQMTLIGRMLKQDWEGQRLRNLQPGVTLRIPTPMAGVFYTLLTTEGVFAFTPHGAATRYFAVVKNGDTVVSNVNRAQVTFSYDPVNDPVQPHAQFDGATDGGYPYTAYVVWVDGRPDPNDARPDFPVAANQNRNGVPHVFAITRPLTPLPATPYPCVFAMHGGHGAYQNFMPGRPERANMTLELTNGIVVTPNDNLYFRIQGQTTSVLTAWFGYVSTFDPFTDAPRTYPPSTDVVINYTSRLVNWLLDWVLSPASGYNVDPLRVAMIGHSAGAVGTSHLTRQFPERFCAAVAHCPPYNDLDDGNTPNPLFGRSADNLATNLLDTLGQPIGVQTVIRTPSTRLSSQRDFCFTHYYVGIRDDNDGAAWTPVQRAAIDGLNASGMGVPISWDEREHGVEKWHTDEDDLTDDPAYCDPWPDIGQWIHPVKTERQSAQYLVDTYRSNRSYPGYFNSDDDPLTPGRSPDPGPGDPCAVGLDAWGTWSGYCDWDGPAIVDQLDRWECVVFLRGLSAISVDNAPISEGLFDVSLRRTQAFEPPQGSSVTWWLLDEASRVILQSGIVTAGAESLVIVPGVVVRRDPDRSRLIASTDCIVDFDGGGSIDSSDIARVIDCLLISGTPGPECIWVDRDAGGSVNGLDIQSLVNCMLGV